MTLGELLEVYERWGQPSEFVLKILRKHLAPWVHVEVSTLGPQGLPDIVAKVQAGYKDERRRFVGGPAAADRLRSGVVTMVEWAVREGRLPHQAAPPTSWLSKREFGGIGSKQRTLELSEVSVRELLGALGVGSEEALSIDLKVNPRVDLASRYALLLIMHLPLRGILEQPADAVDLEARCLRQRAEGGVEREVPLSAVVVQIVRELRSLPGSATWLVPSSVCAGKHLADESLSRTLKRLQTTGADGAPARIGVDEGGKAFTLSDLRWFWAKTARGLGIASETISAVMSGGQKEGAEPKIDAALTRAAMERVSAALERLRTQRVVATPPATQGDA